MIISLIDVFKILITLGILITPLLHIGELTALFSGTLTSQSEVMTPLYIKILKDFVMLSIVFLLFIKYFVNKIRFFYFISIFFLLILVFFSIANTFFVSNQDYIIYGLRWFYPIFIFLFGIHIFDKKIFDQKFDIVLIIIFIIHLSIQLFQFFSGIFWFGLIDKYSARNPGIFLLPNTGAFFSIVFLFYILFLKEKQRIKYKFLLTVFAISKVKTENKI